MDEEYYVYIGIAVCIIFTIVLTIRLLYCSEGYEIILDEVIPRPLLLVIYIIAVLPFALLLFSDWDIVSLIMMICIGITACLIISFLLSMLIAKIILLSEFLFDTTINYLRTIIFNGSYPIFT